MSLNDKIKTNLFEEEFEYAKTNFWISFGSLDEELFQFKQLCKEEKIELDQSAMSESRKTNIDSRLIFRKHTPRSRILFVLFLLKLWSPS